MLPGKIQGLVVLAWLLLLGVVGMWSRRLPRMKPARTGPLSSYLGTSITRLNSSQDQTQNFCKLQCHLHTQTCEQKKRSPAKSSRQKPRISIAHTDPERVARTQIPGERLRKTMRGKNKKLDHGEGAHTLSRDAGSGARAGRIPAAT